MAAPGLAGGSNQTGGFGQAVAVGDVNRDRVPDFIVGVPDGGSVGKGFSTSGQVLVYNGRNRNLITTLDGDTLAPGAVDFGASVAAGDVNRDGYADIIVGDPNGGSGSVPGAHPQGDVGSGRVTVISGRTFEVLRTLNRNDFGNSFSSIDSVAAGDLNGDGRADIIVSDDDGDENGSEDSDSRGALSVFNGANYSLLYQLDGTDYSPGFSFGRSVAVGDWNRDGRGDLLVLDSGAPERGRIYVVSGKNTRRILQVVDLASSELGSINSIAAGRFDGDVYLDVAVGDPDASFGGGRVTVFSSRNLARIAAFDAVRYNADGSNFGTSVAIVPHRSTRNTSTRGKVLVGDPTNKVNGDSAVRPQGSPVTTGTVYIIRRNSFLEGRLVGTSQIPV